MHALDGSHVCLNLDEEDGPSRGVISVVVAFDGVIQSCLGHRCEDRVGDGDVVLGRLGRVLGGCQRPRDGIDDREISGLAGGMS